MNFFLLKAKSGTSMTGWSGVECFDEEATVNSISIHSEDSNEEYFDTRSCWLYAYAAAAEQCTVYQASRPAGCVSIVDHLKPAPHIEFQIRTARYRVQRTMHRLGIRLEIDEIRLSTCLRKAVAKG